MKLIEVSGLPPRSSQSMVLAIGKFDGVHIGHRAILKRAKSYLGDDDSLAVMSLWPHPAWVLGKQQAFRRSLTPFPEKARLLEEQGVDYLYRVEFTPEYAKISAEDFVCKHLARLSLRYIVVGEDFHFGAGGVADVNDLRNLCEKLGISVAVVPDVVDQGAKVCSSQIRDHILSGRVDAAEALLGRPYCIRGTVVHGDRQGRLLGFPTANFEDTAGYVLPGSGVYAVSVALMSEESAAQNWFGVMNAGMRPTVGGSKFQMEAHLLDFSGDLYGKEVEVSLLGRVRDERRFPNVEELKTQIQKDIQSVREMFGLTSHGPNA